MYILKCIIWTAQDTKYWQGTMYTLADSQPCIVHI